MFEDFRQMSAQTIFSALDYLNRWARAKAYRLVLKKQLVTSKHRNSPSVSGTSYIFSFLLWNMCLRREGAILKREGFRKFSLSFSLIGRENLCSFSTNQTSDKLLISPYIITLKSNVKVTRRKEMIANLRSS